MLELGRISLIWEKPKEIVGISWFSGMADTRAKLDSGLGESLKSFSRFFRTPTFGVELFKVGLEQDLNFSVSLSLAGGEHILFRICDLNFFHDVTLFLLLLEKNYLDLTSSTCFLSK